MSPAYKEDPIVLLVKKFVETEIRLIQAARAKSVRNGDNAWENRDKFREVNHASPVLPYA